VLTQHSSAAPSSGPRTHVLTVNAEEYFHGRGLSGAVLRKHWDRLESRLEHNIDDVLALLARYEDTATFFVFGWSAEKNPRVVRKIVDAGHEVGSRGFWPGPIGAATPDEFRESLRRTRDALLAAGAPSVLGFRAPRWISDGDTWILDVLAEEGYLYDASINPILRRFAHDPRMRTVGQLRHSHTSRSIWEVPISTVGVLGLRIAISGGNYLRQLPRSMIWRAVTQWHERCNEPLVFYFSPWEIDPAQPHIAGVPRLERIRQYRHLNDARDLIEEYLLCFRFRSIAEHLGLTTDDTAQPVASENEPETESATLQARSSTARLASRPQPVSIVVPVFNEEESITYLARTLDDLVAKLADRYRLQFVIVDDGSEDHTYAELQRVFGERADTKLVRLDGNHGTAKAILAGIRNADHEIVCSIDCDCSYDPLELANMIPLIDGADLVTASPYHPHGNVINVPAWRLFLSKNLSRLYGAALGANLSTYTSCFRVYRRSAVEALELDRGGFLGVAEMLIRMHMAGSVVREYPATLESRILGASKMKTLRVVVGHVGLLAKILLRRSGIQGIGTHIPLPDARWSKS
jgi:polysaccharide deacetylase family protein (PEP-CTERM system associated)